MTVPEKVSINVKVSPNSTKLGVVISVSEDHQKDQLDFFLPAFRSGDAHTSSLVLDEVIFGDVRNRQATDEMVSAISNPAFELMNK
jgi:hypothetical protein